MIKGTKYAFGFLVAKRIKECPPSCHAHRAEPGVVSSIPLASFVALSCICVNKIMLVWWCLMDSACCMRKSDVRITVKWNN